MSRREEQFWIFHFYNFFAELFSKYKNYGFYDIEGVGAIIR